MFTLRQSYVRKLINLIEALLLNSVNYLFSELQIIIRHLIVFELNTSAKIGTVSECQVT